MSWLDVRPVWAARIIAALMAVALAGGVYRIPIQVSDSLEIIQSMSRLPSVGAALGEGLFASHTMLRPLRQVRTKVLIEAADALGGRYHLVFRGYHAIGAAMLVVLFLACARPRTWTETVAFTLALTVLTGMHGFSGMVREAYPVNHFLLITAYALATYLASRSRGGWVPDLVAVGCFVVAALTLESGQLVWVVAAIAYVAGLRGVSRGALIAMTALLVAYLALRIGYLHIAPATLGDRQTGFGAESLSASAALERFGSHRWALYLYTATTSAVSVLLSQPTYGQWTVLQAFREGRIPPVYLIEVGSSMAATLLAVWYAWRRPRDPIVVVTGAVLVTNAALTFAYAKDEIVSVASAFYALAVYAAACHALDRLQAAARGWRPTVAIIVMALAAAGWAFRDAGLQFKLRASAFDARTEWATVLSPRHPEQWPSDSGVLAITRTLMDESLHARTGNLAMLPLWGEDWWGPK